LGYFDIGQGGDGEQYYDSDMHALRLWNKQDDGILYAMWDEAFVVPLDSNGGQPDNQWFEIAFGDDLPSGLTIPTRMGYKFWGYFDSLQLYDSQQYFDSQMVGLTTWDRTEDTTLYAKWEYIVDGGDGGDADDGFIGTKLNDVDIWYMVMVGSGSVAILMLIIFLVLVAKNRNRKNKNKNKLPAVDDFSNNFKY
jgi:hypothetical protein